MEDWADILIGSAVELPYHTWLSLLNSNELELLRTYNTQVARKKYSSKSIASVTLLDDFGRRKVGRRTSRQEDK